MKKLRAALVLMILALAMSLLMRAGEPDPCSECWAKLGFLQGQVIHAMTLSAREQRQEARRITLEALEKTGLECTWSNGGGASPTLTCIPDGR